MPLCFYSFQPGRESARNKFPIRSGESHTHLRAAMPLGYDERLAVQGCGSGLRTRPAASNPICGWRVTAGRPVESNKHVLLGFSRLRSRAHATALLLHKEDTNDTTLLRLFALSHSNFTRPTALWLTRRRRRKQSVHSVQGANRAPHEPRQGLGRLHTLRSTARRCGCDELGSGWSWTRSRVL